MDGKGECHVAKMDAELIRRSNRHSRPQIHPHRQSRLNITRYIIHTHYVPVEHGILAQQYDLSRRLCNRRDHLEQLLDQSRGRTGMRQRADVLGMLQDTTRWVRVSAPMVRYSK